MARGYLVLGDGTVYEGNLFADPSPVDGEIVFGTGMGGYQENLTDPSFAGQILVMTYPLIGSYGIAEEFSQSNKAHVKGLVVRDACSRPTRAYGGMSLENYLAEQGVPGISGIDTRDLVAHIRDNGAMKGAITGSDVSPEETVKRLSRLSDAPCNYLKDVSVKDIVEIPGNKEMTVGVLDCGMKNALIDSLSSKFNVVIFPYDTPSDVLSERKIDGLVISGGPGNPSNAEIINTTGKTLKDLVSAVPMFGIGLGGQILAESLGAETYKMKNGHRGSSHPVLFDGRVYATSQNHGYAVNKDSLGGTGLTVNQTSVNDGSVEGCIHKNLPLLITQYHPEAGPGSTDTLFLFDKFGKTMKEAKR